MRGRGDRRALLSAARLAVHSVNTFVPLASVATLDELIQASIIGRRPDHAAVFSSRRRAVPRRPWAIRRVGLFRCPAFYRNRRPHGVRGVCTAAVPHDPS